MKLSRHYCFATALSVLVLFVGCKEKQEIKVYRVSKAEAEAVPPSPMGSMGGAGAMPGMPGAGQPGVGAESAPELTGTAPSNWEAQAPSSMRQASYLIKGENGATADASIVVLGGAAGGTLDNVNRWLGQLGQPAISEEKLAQISQHITSPLGDVLVVDLEGLPQGADPAKDGRIIAGIALVDGKTLFFKIRGNAALVESQKEGFIKWVGTVHFSQPTTAAAADSSSAAPGAQSESEVAQPQIKWQTPEDWKPAPASSMRYASFAVAGQNGETGDISVSVFPGETGGDLANVNRWRGQVGLDPITEADLKSVVTNVSGTKTELKVVDLTGPKSRLLAGWARNNGNTWFFKLTGSESLVGAEKDKFMKFLQSVQFNP